MVELEENRVYNIGEIGTLRTTGARLLDTGIASCSTWDMEISELESLQSGTPVKCAELKDALGAVSGQLNKPEYDTDKCWIDNLLNNIIGNIPQKDMEGKEVLEPLAENLQTIMGMMEDLLGCIGAAGTNLTLSEYQQKLEGIKQEWDDEILEDNFDRFETDLLGISQNVSYSADWYANEGDIAAYYGIDWKELLKEMFPDNSECLDSALKEINTSCYAIPETDRERLTEEQQESNARYIYDYLSAEGWTTEAICGLLGNIQEESQMNPGVWQSRDNAKHGYGIVQWTSASDKFLAWLEEYEKYEIGNANNKYAQGVEIVNNLALDNPQQLMDLQLKYLVWSCGNKASDEHRQWSKTLELDSPYEMTYEQYIASDKNPGDLALVFHASYERSGDTTEERKERSVSAEKWYQYFTHN